MPSVFFSACLKEKLINTLPRVHFCYRPCAVKCNKTQYIYRGGFLLRPTMTALLCWVIVHHKSHEQVGGVSPSWVLLLSYFRTVLKSQHIHLQCRKKLIYCRYEGSVINVLWVHACPIKLPAVALLWIHQDSCTSDSHCSTELRTCFVIIKEISLLNDTLYAVPYRRCVFDVQIISKRCPLQSI